MTIDDRRRRRKSSKSSTGLPARKISWHLNSATFPIQFHLLLFVYRFLPYIHSILSATMPPKQRTQISSSAQTVPPIPKPQSSTTSSTTTTTTSSKLTSSASNANQSAQEILSSLWGNYLKSTPQRVKLIDVFMGFLVVVGGLQFLYVVVVGNYVSSGFYICWAGGGRGRG